ncbi:uncharacterized protein LOC133901045 [Phragmites australis]|uniref:uncharacterized protein LOC133901045 n=1 Tax=Phragmites australis TaxID=29695 RepID=UPI002D792F21|nr:uncharacterized protein LOC133901045 [Phragmites australis]
MAASSSSSGASRAAVTARGIRILDGPEVRRRTAPWVSSGLDGDDEEEGVEAAMAMARARGCDVYVGHSGGARRMVAWLRAELEMLGVPCVASDRRQCGDAPAHVAARAAMDVAASGVVVVTPESLANPYAVEEIRVFLDRGALVPVLVGLGRGDLVAEDVVEKLGDLWGTHGGHLWKLYDGAEAEWREAVEGLARAEPALVVGDGDLRDRVLDVLEILGARLGRRAVTAAVKAWRAAADMELPFPRNAGFVGREKELLDVEAMLRGSERAYGNAAGKRAMDLDEMVIDEGPFVNGVVCISGVSGAGKTELALEFAHRLAHEYKKVLWVHGEARYLRQSYLKLADHLGVAVGDGISQSTDRSRSLPDIEGDAIAKIRKELMRDIPYLVVIDNLESERDWWDGRALQELLPRGSKRTHVVVTTRLGRLQGVRTWALGNLGASDAMLLMKGTRTFSTEDMAVLRSIEEKVGSVPLGLALVGAILSELAIGPAELRHEMSHAPHRAPTWASKDDPALRDKPGLAQLLDACFALLDRETAGFGTAAARLLEASSFFAPAPIPMVMLARAACACAAGEPLWKRFVRTLQLSCTAPPKAGHVESEVLAMLLRLGITQRCTQAGCISVHGVFRLFSRKVGSGQVGRSVVRAIAAQGGRAEQYADHMWAACLSLFRFEAPAVAVELPPLELARFVTRSVLPLAARAVAAYSAYSAALELLREATDGVRVAEDQYIAAPRRGGGSGSSSSNMELDPRVYQEVARARAELLKTRARMMVRAGEHAIAKDHCLTAIGILEVVCGGAHPETQAVRAFLEQAVRVQTMN